MVVSSTVQLSGHTSFDIDAREAEILGKPQRVEPLDRKDFDAEALKIIIALRESAGVRDHSVLPEIFATMLRHPDLYRCTMVMGTQLMGKGELPPRERELAVLLVGWLCRAPYEWSQHVHVAKRCGVTAEEIERVTQGSSAAGWNEHDAAILRGVEELLADKMITDETWSVLARKWNDKQLMEFPTLVGEYVTTAYSQNALRIRLNPDSKGLKER